MDAEAKVIFFVALVAAIILHEISHGLVAWWFGDDTARRAGRITLNPAPHIDPFGSIIVPAMGALAGIPVIGWAKPVPVDARKLRDPRRHMLYVTLAGPATNLGLMLVAAFVARQLYTPSSDVVFLSDLPLTVQILLAFAVVNLFLGLFNLVPIPPLDGSAIVERMLPNHMVAGWQRFQPYGIAVIFALVFFTHIPGNLFQPFLRHLYSFVLR